VNPPRTLVVRPSAENDVAESAIYYADNAGVPTAERFLLAVRRSIEAVMEAPEAWPAVTATKRKYPVFVQDSSFQHLLYYRVTAAQVIVVAILHGARAPATWKRRR
jgi:plasmid stabilization system protein ParE